MHDSDIQQGFQADMSASTLEDVNKFIENATYSLADGCSIHLAITNNNNEYLGTISLKEISFRDRRAEYAISLRKCAQRKGIGYKATQLLLYHAFYTLGLNRVFLNVLSDNLSVIHLYRKCGFLYEGKFTNHLFLRGCYRNLEWYGMERKDYLRKEYSYEDYAKQA